MKRASQVPIVAALAVSVIGAGVARSLVMGQRHKLDVARHVENGGGADLSKVNSFALGLLLGGLRGPLVMALWTSSENQKTERDLEDFDTKVELIRLLQPEFDTVHLFQIWNKAYNISVQMANVPNKYTTILDALFYAFNVDRERPDNINILTSIAGLYFDKYGEASEKIYFRSRFEAETMPLTDRVHVTFDAADKDRAVREARLAGASAFQLGVFDADEQGKRQFLNLPAPMADALKTRFSGTSVNYETIPVKTDIRRDSAGRPLQHESLLDAQFQIKPEFTTPHAGQPDVPTGESGARLPYLSQFGPYPYGVSPYALAYNYYKRSDWLQVNRNARHAQVNERVIASRGGKSIEKWSEEEWHNATRAEIDLAGKDIPQGTEQLFAVTADLTLQADLPRCPLFDQAIWRYETASKLALRAIDEYEQHIVAYGEDEVLYRSQIRDLAARSELVTGEARFLRALHANADDRRKFAAEGSAAYLRAANLYTRILIRYYVEDSDVKNLLPRDVRNLKRTDADENPGQPSKIRDDELAPILKKILAMHAAANNQLGNSTDVNEINTYVQRAYARKRTLDLAR